MITNLLYFFFSAKLFPSRANVPKFILVHGNATKNAKYIYINIL
jgi:hypothetical protein